MRSILFHIPHEIAGWPVFGLGWALAAWTLFSLLWQGWQVRKQGWNEDTLGFLPVLGMVGLAMWWVLPLIEDRAADGEILGLAVRGYGVFLLTAVVSGVAAAVYRARQMGVDPEHIFSLAFWMFLTGIVGARLMYVLLKPTEFFHGDWFGTLGSIVNITSGGLVVYGAFLAAAPFAYWYLRRHKLPALAMADLVAPSLMLGLAIGRVGCFMHGCCYGGLCTLPWGVTFPGGVPASPPYAYQQSLGLLHGFRVSYADDGPPRVAWLAEDGPAERAGLQLNDRITAIDGAETNTANAARDQLLASGSDIAVTTSDGRKLTWSAVFPPRTPLAMHPAQLYAALTAALLFLVLWHHYPLRRTDGETIGLMLVLYPAARFVEEMVRDDEQAFVLNMTVSQSISVVLCVLGISLLVAVSRQARSRAWPV